MITHRRLSAALIAITLILPALGVTSCRHNSTIDSIPAVTFSEQLPVAADSVEIGVVLKAGKILSVEPYILVSDNEHTDGMHFAVFTNNLQYLYSFCPYGSGPADCLLPVVVKNTPAGHFIVKDFANDTYHEYSLTDYGATETRTFKLPDFNPYESLWEINRLSDDKYLAKGVAPKRAIRRLVEIGSGTSIDSLMPSFDLFETMGTDYFTEYDDFAMVATDSHFACAYFLINRIEFGSIENESIRVTKSIGTNNPPNFYRYTDEELSGKYKYNVDYNTVYYESIFGSPQRVYASYFGQPWGEIDKHSHIIEIYNYDGDPILKLLLDIPVSSFVVVDDKRIIAINPERSDDSFYIFDIAQARNSL